MAFSLFALPIFSLTAVYVAAALFPAVFLMGYIYRADTIEKEPPGLLMSLVGRGVLAALAAMVLEILGQQLLPRFVSPESPGYVACFAFLVVAAAEEGCKLFFLYRRTWQDPNFNCRFDGIVYAAFVSLGFAAYENLRYVFSYGLQVALPRAILAVPGHLGFAVFMGYFYSRARLAADRRRPAAARGNLLLGYGAAVALHGVYDTCCMAGTGASTAAFVGFVAVMYLAVIRLIRREARKNQFI